MADANQNNFYDNNDYSQSDNHSRSSSDRPDFADDNNKCATDKNFIFKMVRDILVNAGISSYSYNRFEMQLYSAEMFFFNEIRINGKRSKEFLQSRTIPVMVERGQSDGENGRHNEYLIPKGLVDIETIEFSAGGCCSRPMKELHDGEWSDAICGTCKSGKVSENYNACNKCKACFTCKNVYIERAGRWILPFHIHAYSEIYVVGHFMPELGNKDPQINFPPQYFNVLTHYIALLELAKNDGDRGGGYAYISDMFKVHYDQMIKGLEKEAESDDPVRWNEPYYRINVENYGVLRKR